MIDKMKAIKSLLPTAQIASAGDVITWVVEPASKPSDAEIEAEVARLTALEPARIATENRRAAYITESQTHCSSKHNEVRPTMEEWQAKVAEIKTRFPKD
jgi:hypothetical protein